MIRRLVAAAGLGLASSVLASATAACSTIALDDVVLCTDNADCKLGQLCQNGECYDNTLAPADQIGLDLDVPTKDGNFRVELFGDDRLVEQIVDQSPARFRVRLNNGPAPDEPGIPQESGVRDRLSLGLVEHFELGGQAKRIQLTASLQLDQASRLRRIPPRGDGMFAPADEDAAEISPNDLVVLPWARYDPADSDDPLHLTIRPVDGKIGNDPIRRAPIHRLLARKEAGVASIQRFEAIPTRRECHRKLVGNILVLGDADPLDARVSVEFLHTHSAPEPGKSVCDPSTTVQAVCEPSTIEPNVLPPCTTSNDCPPPYGCYDTGGQAKQCGCDSDAECHTGQICELQSHRCALDLDGMPATNGAVTGVTNPEGKTTLDAWVYTYCDEDRDKDRDVAFRLNATSVALDDDMNDMTPPPPSRLPALAFAATVNILANDDITSQLPGNLCFPDWQPPRDLPIEASSAPQEVYRDEQDRPWVCCSTDCLGMNTADPPPAPDKCPLVAELSARTLYTQDPGSENCLALAQVTPGLEPDTQWVDVGGRVQIGACVDSNQTPTPCTIGLTAGTGSLDYELRIAPPVGSLVRSAVHPATVDGGTMKLSAPALTYRVLLRGNVALEVDPAVEGSICTEVTECVVQAEVLAERIRLPDEDPATVVGPYFYTTRTIEGSDTGEFVLPVNPGVYLLTALPAISRPGGPAKIVVVDLRLDSDLVDTRGEIPTATLENPLVLSQQGQFVIFELSSFDYASVATPFDIGSWTGLTFEGRPLDLNDPLTCHGDLGRACSIRRLRAGNSGLALTQEQFVKFIARTCPAGQDGCACRSGGACDAGLACRSDRCSPA